MATLNVRFDSIRGAPYVLAEGEILHLEDGRDVISLEANRRGRARGYALAMVPSENQGEEESEVCLFDLLVRRTTRIQAMRTVDLEKMFERAEMALNKLIFETAEDEEVPLFAFSKAEVEEVGTTEQDDEKGVAADAYAAIIPYLPEEPMVPEEEAALTEEVEAAIEAVVEGAEVVTEAEEEVE